MDRSPFWTCARCGTRNKALSRVCLACDGEKAGVEARLEPVSEPFRMTRFMQVALVLGLVAGLGLAAVMVLVFRSPGFESGQAAPEPAAGDGKARGAEPTPAPNDLDALPRSARSVPVHAVREASSAPPEARAATPAADPLYVLMLREKRVDDLRARLAAARTRDERAALEEWLASAQRDLSDARRTAH